MKPTPKLELEIRFGLEMELLTPKEALSLWPIMETKDLVGAAFLPNDCQANPSDITMALAKGARLKGASIIEDTSVLELLKDDDKITGVKTSKGDINCEKVVCCAGQWSRELSMRFGINVPFRFNLQSLIIKIRRPIRS